MRRAGALVPRRTARKTVPRPHSASPLLFRPFLTGAWINGNGFGNNRTPPPLGVDVATWGRRTTRGGGASTSANGGLRREPKPSSATRVQLNIERSGTGV